MGASKELEQAADFFMELKATPEVGISLEMAAHQLVWYQYLSNRQPLSPGDYAVSKAVWLFDKPYVWVKETATGRLLPDKPGSAGQLKLVPDRLTRQSLNYQLSKQFIDTCPPCVVCEAEDD